MSLFGGGVGGQDWSHDIRHVFLFAKKKEKKNDHKEADRSLTRTLVALATGIQRDKNGSGAANDSEPFSPMLQKTIPH